MTDDQANHHQSTVPTCCLFMTPRHNRPSHAEQMVWSYLTVSELVKKLREDGPLPRLSKSSQPIIGKEAS